MSEPYAREILRRNVAQICQTIGWNGINSTPLDILVHIIEKYIRTLGTQANRFAEQFERTEPNLNDLGLVFRDLHIQLPDIAEYARYVPPIPASVTTEKFPKPKEPHLNFLKPGSHEVVTRPMHVHEHLPPMYPEKERDTPVVADTVEVQQNGIDVTENGSVACNSPDISVTDSPEKSKDIFKRPIDPVALPNSKRPRLRLDEEERTREISSVMMTMSGFLSPAREGKLPEAKAPMVISEKHHDKHKTNHSNLMKVPLHASVDKIDKKSKKSKLVNGKIMKSKRKDKSHKDDGKSREGKSDKYPPGHPLRHKDMMHGHSSKSKDVHLVGHNHIPMPMPKMVPSMSKSMLPSSTSILDNILKPVIKQEPPDPPPSPHGRGFMSGEDSIPVPRKIPISRSPLVSNFPINKHSPNLLLSENEIKKEYLDKEEKLESQPDRSKVNIFKRISNKAKDDKSTQEVVLDKSVPSTARLNSGLESRSNEYNIKVKSQESLVNNNDDGAVDLSKEMDLTTNEVISLDDDSFDMHPLYENRHLDRPLLSINKALQQPQPKDFSGISPNSKPKKDKKHRDKKDKAAERAADKAAEKAAKLEAKLIKKQQMQLQLEMERAQKKRLKASTKSPKLNRKNESKMPPMPPGFSFFPNMHGSGLIPGPGLIPNPGLIPGGDIFAGLANNPALRGLTNPNLLNNPFAGLGGGPGLIPGMAGLLPPGSLGPGLPNPLMNFGNFGHSSRSSSSKLPQMLRRPSLEVTPINNDDDRGLHRFPTGSRDKERHEKHKSPIIPNILQKQKKPHKDKSNLKMPMVHPDVTIQLNPPKQEKIEIPEPPKVSPPPPVARPPIPEPVQIPVPLPMPLPVTPKIEPDLNFEKRKDKSHKKEKKEKEGIKIKRKKDKKDKNKDKSEKKKDKEEKHDLEKKIKKEKKEKKKEKVADGVVPKLTLKLGSASPMPPSSPDVFKLNIKPIVKKEDDTDSTSKVDSSSREHSRSPELAQFSPLVTRPPKQKLPKQNNSSEGDKSPPATSSSPSRKNRPPGHKFKRILFKSLNKKGSVENIDETEDMSEETEATPPQPSELPPGPLPTPFYVDNQGNKIWVCPACGRPDNGSPMIGCDGCDGWYHWVCVGITEEPGATEDWFCKSCVAKRAAMVFAGVPGGGRKRGRKPKPEKVNH